MIQYKDLFVPEYQLNLPTEEEFRRKNEMDILELGINFEKI